MLPQRDRAEAVHRSAHISALQSMKLEMREVEENALTDQQIAAFLEFRAQRRAERGTL